MPQSVIPSPGGKRKVCARKRTKRTPKPSFDLDLKTMGIRPAARNCIQSWISCNAIHRDWTQDQLAAERNCHRTQISRALPTLIEHGMVVLKQAGCLGDDPKAATYLFTEDIYLLAARHCAKRTSPLGFSLFQGTSNTTRHRYKQAEKPKPVVPDAWRDSWDHLLEVVQAIPSPSQLNPSSLMTLVEHTPFPPEKAIGFVEAAGKLAVTQPNVRDARMWALATLKNPEFAERFIPCPVPIPPEQPASAPGEEAVPPVKDDLDALQDELVAAGMGTGGAVAGIEGLRQAGIDLSLAQHYAAEAMTQTAKAVNCGRIDKEGWWGLMVKFLRTPDPILLGRARKAKAKRDRLEAAYGIKTSATRESLAKMAPRFQVFPGAREAFVEWQYTVAQAPAADSPGFLDHFDLERKAFRKVIGLGEAFLGQRALGLKTEVEARLRAANMKPDSLVWRRGMDHHFSRAIAEALGIG